MKVKKDYVKTATGTKITFLDPQPDQIKLRDIAWNTARLCRYNGGTIGWYSVAEHEVIGAKLALRTIASPSIAKIVAREFLIHDTAEFVFGDPAAPITSMFPELKVPIKKFQRYLNKLFLGYEDLCIQVDSIDKRLCSTEMRDLRFQPEEDYWDVPYTQGVITFHQWEWEEAFKQWVAMFRSLFPEHEGKF
jgi:hypothetical protein